MSGLPDPSPLLIALLALAAGLAMLRLARHRRWLLAALQLPLAALLGVALLWQPAERPGLLVLLTEGSSAAQIATQRAVGESASWRRLPGAPAEQDVPLSVDLAAALRETGAGRVVILGHGLNRAELAVLGDRPARFAPPARQGPAIVALSTPPQFTPGQRWRIEGRVEGIQGGHTLHLIDPAGREIDRSLPAADGGFRLQGSSPLVGDLDYAVALREGEQVIQRLPYRLRPRAAGGSRGLLWAAAPSPEIKFLRRWALDAGLELDARIGLRPGLAVRRGNDMLSATALAELDLLIIDARSWNALGNSRAAVIEALRGGLGVLLRLEQASDAGGLAELGELGLVLAPTADELSPTAVASSAARLVPGTTLHALPLQATARHLARLDGREDLGQAAWTALGQGRIGASWLLDSYQLVQQGQAEVHASHWAALWQALARPRPAKAGWQLAGEAIAGRRLMLCGDGALPRLRDASGRTLSTARTPGSPCVSFWPPAPGRWQVQVDPEPEAAGWIDVLPEQAASPLQHEARRLATLAHAERHPFAAASATDPAGLSELTPPQIQALLLLGWLLLAGLVGWLERRILLGAD